MQRNNLHHTLCRRALWSPLFAGVVVSLFSPAAFSHTLLVSQGEVVVEECQASVTLSVAAEDFLHWYDVSADSNGLIGRQPLESILERHASALQRVFVIRDASGNPLPSEPFGFHMDWPAENLISVGTLRSLRAKYSSRFSYPCAPRFLTFQLLMGGDNPSIFWQAILSVHGASDKGGSVIRLTSRGNAESVELMWCDKQAKLVQDSEVTGDCRNAGVGGLKQVCADIDIGLDSMDVQLAIPLSLLQTWIGADRNDDAFFDPDEQKSTENEIRKFLAGALSVEIEGRRYTGQITEIVFLPIAGQDSTTPIQRVSLLTGRMFGTLRIGPFSALKQADLQWNLFNNAVHAAVVMISSNGVAVRHEFSTFQPAYHWQRAF